MSTVWVLADHGALEALPFFVPAAAIGLFLAGAMVRERFREDGS